MASGLENSLMFTFEAQDLASDKATLAEKLVNSAAVGVEESFADLATAAENLTMSAGVGMEELGETSKASLGGLENTLVGLQAVMADETIVARLDELQNTMLGLRSSTAATDEQFESFVARTSGATDALAASAHVALSASGGLNELAASAEVAMASFIPDQAATAMLAQVDAEAVEMAATFADLGGVLATFGTQFSKGLKTSAGEALVAMSNVEENFASSGDRITDEAKLAFGALNGLAGAFNALGSGGLPKSHIDALIVAGRETAFWEKGLLKLKSTASAVALPFQGLAKVVGVFASFGKLINAAGTELERFGKAGKVLGAIFQGIGNTLGGGGIAGFLLGPLAPMLKLLQPIIDILVSGLEPALAAIAGAVENAFAPFFAIVDQIAQSLMPVIQTMLAPLADILTVVAIQVGSMLQNIKGGGGVVSGIMAAIQGLMPVVERVVGALAEAAGKVLPAIGIVVSKLVPPLVKIVTIFAEAFVNRIEVFADLIADVAPLLAETFAELLMAVLPLVDAAVKLGSALLKHVFAPALKLAIMAILTVVKAITPTISAIISVVSNVISGVTARIEEFWGNLKKYGTQLYGLFVKPVVEGVQAIISVFSMEGVFESVKGMLSSFFELVKSGWNTIVSFVSGSISGLLQLLGLDSAAGKVEGIFAALQAAVLSPIETIKGLINEFVIGGINKVLGWAPVKSTLGQLLNIPDVPKLAGGGVAGEGAAAVGGIPAIVGEAGPEAIIPLRPDVVREKVAPALLEGLELPGMGEVVMLLRDINSALGRPLTVRALDSGDGGAERAAQVDTARVQREESDLDASLGLMGLVAG